jgi:hypothetical protein
MVPTKIVLCKNEITLFAGKWMELEIIMLSRINQDKMPKYTRSRSSVEARNKMMMVMTIITWNMNVHGGLLGRVSRRGEGKDGIHYIYPHEDSIMEPTKHCSEKTGNGESDLVQDTLYARVELS